MNSILDGLLKAVSDWNGKFTGAFNIRENGECAGRQSTKNIRIESKTDKPGLDIRIRPGTKGETVSIPACVTHGGVDDLVYNDFFVGEGADVTIVAGCGVHTDSEELARHNGIHRFFLEKGAHVTYLEKHVGAGKGAGVRSIDPVTEMFLEEDAVMTMDTSQIGGVDKSLRKTSATLAAGAKLHIHERILTEGEQQARTEFEVRMNGAGSGTDLSSPAPWRAAIPASPTVRCSSATRPARAIPSATPSSPTTARWTPPRSSLPTTPTPRSSTRPLSARSPENRSSNCKRWG